MEGKIMNNTYLRGIFAAGLIGAGMVAVQPAQSADVYGPFPVTLSPWLGTEKNSMGYTGQIARHVLHDSLKSLAGKGNGKPNPELKKKMLSYFSAKDAGRKILAPKSNKAVSYTHLRAH